jgi:cell division inhibitor SulA
MSVESQKYNAIVKLSQLDSDDTVRSLIKILTGVYRWILSWKAILP